jgi:hypothetical protein
MVESGNSSLAVGIHFKFPRRVALAEIVDWEGDRRDWCQRAGCTVRGFSNTWLNFGQAIAPVIRIFGRNDRSPADLSSDEATRSDLAADCR